jgi:hypothetical protein
MKNKFLAPFKDISFWIDMCAMYFVSSIMALFGVPWYLTAIFALIAAVVVSVLFLRKNSRAKEINILQKKMRKIMREAKKKGDASFIYETLENELLPAIRNELPRRIYKYYRLSDDTKSNERRLEAIKNNTIWASTYSEFNDPFECQYFYLNESDLLEMGIPNPENAKNCGIRLWNKYAKGSP